MKVDIASVDRKFQLSSICIHSFNLRSDSSVIFKWLIDTHQSNIRIDYFDFSREAVKGCFGYGIEVTNFESPWHPNFVEESKASL